MPYPVSHSIRPIIISIQQKFARAILSGSKKVELRKASFPKNISLAIIYESRGSKKLVGYFTIKRTVVDSPKQIWRRHGKHAGVTKNDFDSRRQSGDSPRRTWKSSSRFRRHIKARMRVWNDQGSSFP